MTDIDVSWRGLGRWARRYVTTTGPWHGLPADYFDLYWPQGSVPTPRRPLMGWPVVIIAGIILFLVLAWGTKP